MADQQDLSPSIAWICTKPSLFTAAKAMLEDKFGNEPAIPDPTKFCSGHVGASTVAITLLPQPAQVSDVETAIQDIAKGFKRLEILITGFGSGLSCDSAQPGDVIISRPGIQHSDPPPIQVNLPPDLLHEAVDILQREVGADGRWLSSTSTDNLVEHRQLRYCNSGANIQNSRNIGFWTGMIATDVDTFLKSLSVTSVTILGVKHKQVSPEDNESSRKDEESSIAACVASYTLELIRLSTMQHLRKTVSNIRKTETIVPPFMEPDMPQFESHQYPLSGKAVLLVIPTANKLKEKILLDGFREKVPNGVDLHTITVPFDSGVGEQPYNEAGCLGAHNRITGALRALHARNHQEVLGSKSIGTVIVASIESYIQTNHVARPVDYGVIVVRNATAEKTTACLSWGTTVDPAYVDRARRFGFDGDANFGRVTVGQVLAAHVPGLDKADWQVVLGGQSRYKLLKDAIAELEIPWGL